MPANASSRSWTSAGAAGRVPSDAVPAAPLVFIGQVQQAVRRRTRAASCRLARLLRVAQALLRVTQHFVNGVSLDPFKYGTILLDSIFNFTLYQMQPPDLISESLCVGKGGNTVCGYLTALRTTDRRHRGLTDDR